MEEKKFNKKITLSIIGILMLIGIIGGITYAYFSAQASTETQTIKTGTMRITFTHGDILRAEDIWPIKESDISSKATELPFTITNVGTLPVTARISLENIVISSELKSADFKWSLYENDSEIASGNFLSTGTTLDLVKNISIPATDPDTSRSYVLRVWIQETGLNQNTMQDKKLEAKVVVSTTDSVQKSLAQTILDNNDVDNSSCPGSASTNGICKSNNVYYFYGSNPNNNIIIKDGIKVQENASAEDGSTIPAKDPYYIDLEAVILGVNSDNTVVILDKDAFANCGVGYFPDSFRYNVYTISNYTTTASDILFDSNTMLKSGWSDSNPNASYICNNTDLGDYSFMTECGDNDFSYSVAKSHSTFTLKSDVTFTGSGTEEDPYVIQ